MIVHRPNTAHPQVNYSLMCCLLQVEARMNLESIESQNQQQAEIQQHSASTTPSDANPGELKAHGSGDGVDIPSTLQYLAQQAEINHAFQEQAKSQRQEKSEL